MAGGFPAMVEQVRFCVEECWMTPVIVGRPGGAGIEKLLHFVLTKKMSTGNLEVEVNLH